MKKIFNYAFILCALVSTASVTSCGSDDPLDINGDTPVTPVTPVTPSQDEAMAAAKQKEYLEDIALDFMKDMPSSDFDYLGKLANCIKNTYLEDYDWDEVDDWGSDILDDVLEATGTKTTETTDWGNKYVYTNYTGLLYASNFTGHFTASAGKWTYTKASDLQFIFNDQNGKQCILKVETSGNVKKVHAFDIDDWTDYEYDSSTSKSTEYYDRDQYTIGVPENIVVTLTQGGSVIMKNTTKINLQSLTGEEFDVSRNSFTLSNTLEFNNGYKFDLSQVAYSANSKASVNFKMSKNNLSLVTIAVAGDVSGIPSCNVSAFSGSNFDFDDYNTENATAKNAYVKIDVLGKMQIQGTISDARKFADYLEDADDNDSSESTYKSYINQANGLVNLGLYYDGTSTKQASVTLEPFVDETWNGKTYWTFEPVLNFYDGSSYSTFEAFFNDTDFKTTIDTFKSLADKYASFIGERIDW